MLYGNKTIGTVCYLGGIPAVYEEFCWAWGALRSFTDRYLCDPGEEVKYWRPKQSYHSYARNVCVENMAGDWLLMLDTDHSPPPDLVVRMVTAMAIHNVDVLTGMYYYKKWPHNPVVMIREGSRVQFLGDWDPGVKLVRIGSAGGGCLLVRRTVFDRINAELNENPFEIRKCFSEDNSFFDRCWELGIQAYCAIDIENPHLRIEEVTAKDYRPDEFRDRIGERHEAEGRKLGVE